MSNDKKYDIPKLTALLDFYSDRATAHASLMVATTFGLFTSLAIFDSDKININQFYYTSLVFWFIWSLGLFELFNFGFYADWAHMIERGITGFLPPSVVGEEAHFIRYYIVTKYQKEIWLKRLFFELKKVSKPVFHTEKYESEIENFKKGKYSIPQNIKEPQNKKEEGGERTNTIISKVKVKLKETKPLSYIWSYFVFFGLLPYCIEYGDLLLKKSWLPLVPVSLTIFLIMLSLPSDPK